MRISGFTILRDTVRLGYPFLESIRSLLPLVDELVVGVGDGEDGTWEAVRAIGDAKLVPFRSKWNLGERAFGRELRVQTNRALERCSGDWAVYLQADEVLHEEDLDLLRDRLHRHRDRRTEALVFRYLHFHASYDTVGDDWRRWYPRAVRAVRTGVGVESVGDACGFHLRRGDFTRGLLKAESGARIFHYGRCGAPDAVRAKVENLRRFYDRGAARERGSTADEDAAFARRDDPLRAFVGTHPRVMRDRIDACDWAVAPPPLVKPWRRWRRALGSLAAYALGGGGDIRPIVPLLFSNSAWWAFDRWHDAADRFSRRSTAR